VGTPKFGKKLKMVTLTVVEESKTPTSLTGHGPDALQPARHTLVNKTTLRLLPGDHAMIGSCWQRRDASSVPCWGWLSGLCISVAPVPVGADDREQSTRFVQWRRRGDVESRCMVPVEAINQVTNSNSNSINGACGKSCEGLSKE
jgi:hypothetical protein